MIVDIEAGNITIAIICGWTYKEEDYTYYGFTRNIPMTRKRWFSPSGVDTLVLPDYFNDLNAMHEAEKVLTGETKDKYINQLVFGSITNGDSHVLFATAAQRAEAFLKVFGLDF